MSSLLTERPDYHIDAWGCRFTVFGKAEPAGSKRSMRHKSSDKIITLDANPKAKDWKLSVGKVAGVLMGGRDPFDGPLYLRLTFYIERPKSHFGKRGLLPSARKHPTTKPDVLKLTRGIEDALTGIVWKDDAQIVDEFCRKRYGHEAKVEIQVGVIV